jgi:hypothetical protein
MRIGCIKKEKRPCPYTKKKPVGKQQPINNRERPVFPMH